MPGPQHFTLKGLKEKDFKEIGEYAEVEGKLSLTFAIE